MFYDPPGESSETKINLPYIFHEFYHRLWSHKRALDRGKTLFSSNHSLISYWGGLFNRFSNVYVMIRIAWISIWAIFMTWITRDDDQIVIYITLQYTRLSLD